MVKSLLNASDEVPSCEYTEYLVLVGTVLRIMLLLAI